MTDLSPFDARKPWLLQLFRWYARGYMARHLHAVRVSREGDRPELPEGPVVVVMNHPSWWDPLVAGELSDLLPGRVVVAPMDAHALKGYGFFAWLGVFGLERGRAGWRRLLAVADEVGARSDGVLWITPQGRFADVREPVELKPGIGHVLHRLGGATLLPVAVEYTLWSERKPEALARVGQPVAVPDGRVHEPEEWTALVTRLLSETQSALARDAISRDPQRFRVLLSSRSGVGGVYDLWRRLRARLRGERFDTEHGAIMRQAEAP